MNFLEVCGILFLLEISAFPTLALYGFVDRYLKPFGHKWKKIPISCSFARGRFKDNWECTNCGQDIYQYKNNQYHLKDWIKPCKEHLNRHKLAEVEQVMSQ